MSILLGFVLSFFITVPHFDTPHFVGRTVSKDGIEVLYFSQRLPNGHLENTSMMQWMHPGDFIVIYTHTNGAGVISVDTNVKPCGEDLGHVQTNPCRE
jgi:hypothetical protein